MPRKTAVFGPLGGFMGTTITGGLGACLRPSCGPLRGVFSRHSCAPVARPGQPMLLSFFRLDRQDNARVR